jgi:hypothetical protein
MKMPNIVKVLNSGLQIITALLQGGSGIPKFVGYGTGTTAPAAGDIGLQTPAAEARTSGTTTLGTTNVANDTWVVEGKITCITAEKAITEVALFDAATAGNCFVRATFSVINLNPGDSITFTFNNVFEEKV